MSIQNIIPFAHQLLAAHLCDGSRALDGTAGNGHDTFFLAQQVGERGRVWAFDVQSQAVVRTRTRLESGNLAHRVRLIHDSHRYLNRYIGEPLDAAVFNFGWLPGGDKNCTTQAESSVDALKQALNLLNAGAVLLAVLYPGHEAGRVEAQAVEQWAAQLPQQDFAVLRYGFINRKNRPPYLLALEKLHQK